MWLSWGVKPAKVGGQGVGELVASCIAGGYEVNEALRSLAEGAARPDLRLGSLEFAISAERPADAVPAIEIGTEVPSWETLLTQLATLYVKGAAIDWRAFDGDYERRRVSLPTYPFERARCWLDRSELRSLPGPFAKVGE
jgi:acyl transferase domain-containing protein